MSGEFVFMNVTLKHIFTEYLIFLFFNSFTEDISECISSGCCVHMTFYLNLLLFDYSISMSLTLPLPFISLFLLLHYDLILRSH